MWDQPGPVAGQKSSGENRGPTPGPIGKSRLSMKPGCGQDNGARLPRVSGVRHDRQSRPPGHPPPPGSVHRPETCAQDCGHPATHRVRRALRRETIERFLHSSYDQFAGRATIRNFLPLLAERWARQRLTALARVEGKITDTKPTVLFLCTHNAGRSQMALGYFNHLAGDQGVGLVRRLGTRQ